MSEKVKKVCELCEEQSATVLCAECCKCYCDRCNKYMHGIESKKGHKTESIPEGVIVDAMCPLHNDALRMFCIDEVKLCCLECAFMSGLHKGHNIIKTPDIAQDNEIFSASEVRKHFADVLKCDDELDKKIEEAIEDIRKEGNEAIKKVKQTFIEAHEKLTEEESKIMEELERVCNESEEVLQKNLGKLREIHKYNRGLNEADIKIQRKETSRLMELNLVCSMEEQRRTMEELHRAMMTDLKIGWDSEGRKLSFTRTLFNGAPIPNNISFPSVLSRGMEISWDCDLNRMSEEDQRKLKYVVEMKKGADEEERGWKEVYSGAERKCSASGLDKDTDYNVRVKCVIGELHGGWSDVAKEKTHNVPEFSESAWKKCPDDVEKTRKYSFDKENPKVAIKIGGSYCTTIGNIALPHNKVVSWNIKILKSKENNGADIRIGVAPFDINQNTDNETKSGWYFKCYDSTLRSGPPHNYGGKSYGPRKGDGQYVRTGNIIGAVMNTANGVLSFALNGANLGVAYEGIPLDKPLVPCVLLYHEKDSVELIIQ